MSDMRPSTPPASTPALKKRDAWWTVLVVDPIATPISRGLRGVTWITPNGITISGLLLGVVSGALFLIGELVWAAVLFELRFLLDCIDGKLARMRDVRSEVGAFIDLAGDKAIIAWNFGALSWFLHLQGLLPAYFPTLLVGAYLIRSWLVLYRIKVNAGHPDQWEGRFGLDQEGPIGTYRRWMAKRRLVGRPNSIDLENVSCFVLPLLFGPTVTAYGLAGTAIYYAAVVILYWVRLTRYLTDLDS